MNIANPIMVKSEDFAVRIIRLNRHLAKTKREYILSAQILRSGTSIGANVAEGLWAISPKDFHAKMSIALKECSETLYWLRLLHRTDLLTDDEYQSIYADCDELRRLLSSITKTTAARLGRQAGRPA